MAASSAGSDVFLAFAFTTICLITLLVLRHYLPIRTSPAYLLVPVFLALALPASVIILVPIDLASASAPEESDPSRGIWLPDRAMLVLWRITYWLTFVLTWVVLPLLADFSDSGWRSVQDRVKYAVRVNLRYQLTVLGTGAVGLVYVFLSRGIYPTSLKSLIMALAYAWGLTLAIYLMGHGLVAIPKKLWRDASLSRKLRHLQSQAPRVWDRMVSAMEELDELEHAVQQLQQKRAGCAADLREWVEELAEMSGLPESRTRISASANTRSQQNIPAVVTDRYLADLTRKLKRARHKKARFVDEWERLKRDAKYTGSIIDAASTRKLDRAGSANTWLDRLPLLTPTLRYYLNSLMIPAFRYAASVFLASASLCIVWSEVIKSKFPQLSIVGLSIVHHPNSDRGQIGFAGQVMAACWLSYMCTAALLSISEVKVWGNRALVRRNTYAESACWYACQVAKLTVPLSYNFTSFVSKDIFENTMFYRFLGRLIDLTPLGLGFDRFFPIFVLVSVVMNAFGLYGRIKNFAGFGVLQDDEADNPEGYGTGSWREGRTLLARDSETPGDDLGLRSRDHSPFPGERNNFIAPYSDRTSLDVSRPSSRLATARVIGRERPARSGTSLDEVEEGSSNFFSDFAHRIRNTIETAAPAQTFTRPRWMQRSSDSSGAAAPSGFTQGLSSWFAGRSSGSGVRL